MTGHGSRPPRSHEPGTIDLEALPVPAALLDRAGALVAANREWDAALSPALRTDGLAEATTDLPAQLERAAHAGGGAIEVTVRGEDGQPRSFVGRCGALEGSSAMLCTLMEITEIRRREAQLAFMATHDVLTGLPNRRMFEDALVRTLARARRGEPGALMMLDIDNLKSYNDALGHARGDQALINFALLLQTHVRAGDMLARVGGDEFGVVLEGASVEEAAEIAERMRGAAASEAFVADARAYDLGMSAGVVPFDGTEEVPQLTDAADAALYEAKNAGRNRVVVRRTASGEGSSADPRAAALVREALTAGRVRLHYQPVIRLLDGSTAYFESLVRLVAEDGEVLMPASFLSVAERLGLMPRLTRHVFAAVSDALATVSGARTSVNLCGSDLLDRSLPDHIERGLGERGVDPRRLSFEIAEHVVATHHDAVVQWADRFTRLGCPLVLDRFGAGARGLQFVSELPFEQVKLDVSTLARLTDEGGGSEYLEAVRRVVEAHGLTVVASRIEDPRVLERVRAAGFRYVQGFDVARPRAIPE